MKTISKSQLDKLGDKDIYSLILYAIYKQTGDPEYSTLSQLVYTVDKTSFINLCSVFGGTTIKIPTIKELKLYVNALVIYDTVSTKGKTFDAAFRETGLPSSDKKEVAKIYNTVKGAIDELQI